MQIFNIFIRRSSSIKSILIEKKKEGIQESNPYLFGIVLGIYNSRLFGVCIYRSDQDIKI